MLARAVSAAPPNGGSQWTLGTGLTESGLFVSRRSATQRPPTDQSLGLLKVYFTCRVTETNTEQRSLQERLWLRCVGAVTQGARRVSVRPRLPQRSQQMPPTDITVTHCSHSVKLGVSCSSDYVLQSPTLNSSSADTYGIYRIWLPNESVKRGPGGSAGGDALATNARPSLDKKPPRQLSHLRGRVKNGRAACVQTGRRLSSEVR